MDNTKLTTAKQLEGEINKLNSIKRILMDDKFRLGIAGTESYANVYYTELPKEIHLLVRPLIVAQINPRLEQLNKEFAAL